MTNRQIIDQINKRIFKLQSIVKLLESEFSLDNRGKTPRTKEHKLAISKAQKARWKKLNNTKKRRPAKKQRKLHWTKLPENREKVAARVAIMIEKKKAKHTPVETTENVN